MSIFESFRKKKTPETPEQVFASDKKKTLDFVLHGDSRPETIQGRINQGIRIAVEKLNALPFLNPTSSCEVACKNSAGQSKALSWVHLFPD